MKWSVALFGHYKPKYYLVEKSTGNILNNYLLDPPKINVDKYFLYEVKGNEKRCFPGDIVAWKPFSDEHKWTEKERQEFLIITIDGPTKEQIVALTEPYWDIASYKEYAPYRTIDAFVVAKTTIIEKRDCDKSFEIDKLVQNKERLYSEHLISMKERSRFPQEILKKRRMGLSFDVLVDMGVDLPAMLDKEVTYSPTLPAIPVTFCNDKLTERQVVTEDRLRTIQPLSDSELELKWPVTT